MGEAGHVLALDQGTTSTRALVFDRDGRVVAQAQRELAQHYPRPGWVEHDPEDLWRDALAVMREAVGRAGVPVRALGIANQRETTLVWERDTGRAVHPAIVWQDRRTAARCEALRAAGAEAMVRARTGLLLDPYFSATKLAWMLEALPGVRARAERGELLFGTVDSFLLWRLCGVHATDAANASRTLLWDVHRGCWDPELLALFGVPAAMLPEVRDNAGRFGALPAALLGAALPVTGMAGDQQAALVGQGCLAPGLVKSTYGTGCFALMNTGTRLVPSAHRLLATVGYRIDGNVTYALEGAIFVAGAAVRWLRDGLGVIGDAAETERLAATLPEDHGVHLVPAFAGLGAPHWRPEARGVISGLTLDSGPAHLARAALEAVAFQTLDLLEAMGADGAGRPRALRVDGGMTANAWLCQFLADVLALPVERPDTPEATALGAAMLAAVGGGLHADLPAAAAAMRPGTRRFVPAMGAERRDRAVAGWREAVRRALG